jgi:hypothetical protein
LIPSTWLAAGRFNKAAGILNCKIPDLKGSPRIAAADKDKRDLSINQYLPVLPILAFLVNSLISRHLAELAMLPFSLNGRIKSSTRHFIYLQSFLVADLFHHSSFHIICNVEKITDGIFAKRLTP